VYKVEICPHCHTKIWNKKAYERHLLFQHDAFSNEQRIVDAVIAHLNTVMDRVEYILLKYTNTRSPKNWSLYLQYSRIFSPNHILVWDSTTKLYTTNPKEGLSEGEMKLLLGEFDSVSRARRKLQEQDRKLYHNNNKDAYYTEDSTHHCILPNEEQVHEAQLSEQAYKSYFKGLK
jgi:hypothetical protein